MSHSRPSSRSSRLSTLLTKSPPPVPPRKSIDSSQLSVPKLREARSQDLNPSPPPIPPTFFGDGTAPQRGRPVSYGGPATRSFSPSVRPSTPDRKLAKKKSWLPSKSRSASTSHPGPSTPAFVITPQGTLPYDMSCLGGAAPVPELWDERGDLFVYLFNDRNPSFRVDASIVSSSKGLAALLQAPPRPSTPELADQVQTLSLADPLQLHIQLADNNLDTLVSIRNLFAFLVGQVLVGTATLPTMFSVFMDIANSLHHYGFANMDGSTLGEAATASFLGYIQDLRLDDVRNSPEKTIEALILAERMKCLRPLYNEAYVHGVGKWGEVLQSPLFGQVSSVTQKRMEKSAMDLSIRIQGVRTRLQTFDIPSLFAGVGSSSAFVKAVDSKSWRMAFAGMRRHTINFYKQRYGAWPPKASSKKNAFEESGLNRILLQELYRDFCDLYDMLVDRTALTTRSIDRAAHDEVLSPVPAVHYLRTLLSEFDRSHPPVQPPVPYDVPRMPSLASLRRGFDALSEKKRAKERAKRLTDDDVNRALMQSYNRDAVKVTPFLEQFMAYERACGHLKSAQELVDLRLGQWIFLYVVLQSLPLVVVDAPGLRWTQGVEYFLCQVPRRSAPWMQRGEGTQNTYYRVAGGAGVVSLPQDVVDFGVEATYQRSHCWEMAARWGGEDGLGPATPLLNLPVDDLPLPPVLGGGSEGSPGSSPRLSNRNSMALGLEALPLPPSVVADELQMAGNRKSSAPDPSKSFEAIIASQAPAPTKKKRWESFGG